MGIQSSPWPWPQVSAHFFRWILMIQPGPCAHYTSTPTKSMKSHSIPIVDSDHNSCYNVGPPSWCTQVQFHYGFRMFLILITIVHCPPIYNWGAPHCTNLQPDSASPVLPQCFPLLLWEDGNGSHQGSLSILKSYIHKS